MYSEIQTPTVEQARIQAWRDALIHSLGPVTRRALYWIWDPEWSGTELAAAIESMGRSPLERAAVRVYFEELAWEAAYGLPDQRRQQ